jgi:hypothetical protein
MVTKTAAAAAVARQTVAPALTLPQVVKLEPGSARVPAASNSPARPAAVAQPVSSGGRAVPGNRRYHAPHGLD